TPLKTPVRWIGRMAEFFAGFIGETRLWTIARSETAIRGDMNAVLTNSPPGLLARWTFDGAAAGVVRDVGPNGYHGALRGGARTAEPPVPLPGPPRPPSPILRFDGSGRIALPTDVFTNLHSSTIEAWVNWSDFSTPQRFFSYGRARMDTSIGCAHGLPDLEFVVRNTTQEVKPLVVRGGLGAGEWHHVAAVSGPEGTRLYLDGDEAATSNATNSMSALPPGPAWLGAWNTDGQRFKGKVAEFRVWAEARTADQVRTNMWQQLSGHESGLAALYNFSDTNQPGRDATPNARHGVVEGSLATASEEVSRSRRRSQATVLFGSVTDDEGRPVAGAQIVYYKDGRMLGRTGANAKGAYQLSIRAGVGACNVAAGFGYEMSEAVALQLDRAERRRLDLTLRRPASIAGKVADAEGRPIVAALVQLTPFSRTNASGAAEATAQPTTADNSTIALTRADGVYRLRRVPPGEYTVEVRSSAGVVRFNDGQPVALGAGTNMVGLDLRAPRRSAPVGVGASARPNRVLALNGPADWMAMPSALFGDLTTATLECWVHWDPLNSFACVFGMGSPNVSFHLESLTVSNDLAIVFNEGPQSAERAVATGVLTGGRWFHVAVVLDDKLAALYVNGVYAANLRAANPFGMLVHGEQALGHAPDYPTRLHGRLDEARIWTVARTPEQIRQTMGERLRGDEDGLAALWNFDDPEQPGRDATGHGFHGTLMGAARTVLAASPQPSELEGPTAISGTVSDPDGRPVAAADVRLTRDGQQVAMAISDFAGRFVTTVPPSDRAVILTARRGEFSCPPTNLVLRPGGNTLNLSLRDSAPFSGRVLALDQTPLSTVVVQAVRASATGGALQPGLVGEYFDIAGLEQFPKVEGAPTVWRVDDQIHFRLANGSISAGKLRPAFYARWKGRLRAAQAGAYLFHLSANDRGRLFLDGAPIVESMAQLTGTHPLADAETTKAVELSEGGHDILVEYVNRIGREGCELAWTPPGRPKETIPASAFEHHPEEGELIVSAMTDTRGVYRFPELAAGDYQIRAQIPGGVVYFGDGRTFTARRDEPLANLDLQIPPFKKGVWRKLNFTDGLANNVVNAAHLAPDGALWFATQGGASRFDGRGFQTLTKADGLSEANVYCVLAETNGLVWFGTMDGLTRRDPLAVPPCTVIRGDKKGFLLVKALVRDRQGQLWASLSDGLARLEGTNLVTVARRPTPTNHGGALMEDSDGVVWWGDRSGIWQVVGPEPQRLTDVDLSASGDITAICEGEPGVLWLGTEQGLTRYDTRAKTNALTHFTTRDGLIGAPVVSLHRDHQGRVWAGTLGKGLSCLDGGSFINYQRADGLPDDFVMSIASDVDQGLWLVTYRGIAGLDVDSMTQWSQRDGLDQGAVGQMVTTTDGSLWVLTGSKLSRYNGREFTKLGQASGLQGVTPTELFLDDDGSLLIADAAAPVTRFQVRGPATDRPRFEVIEGSPPAFAVARSTKGELWFGDRRGAWRSGEEGPSGSGLIGDIVHIERGPNGVLWFQSGSRSVTRFDGTNFSAFGLRSPTPLSLAVAKDGSVMASTWIGPERFDGERFRPFPSPDSKLARLSVSSVLWGARGILHLGSHEGLISFDGVAYATLDERDGLPDSKVKCVHEAPDGALWLALDRNGGIVRHRPLRRPPSAPTITAQTDKDYARLEALPSLLTGQRATFKFDVVDFHTVPEKRQYRWQIFQGSRDENALAAGWQPPSAATQLEQTFSAPGDWTLAVQFIDRDLNYSRPTRATVHVVRPWHANMALMMPAGAGVVGLMGW
ncbi:MAG: carboxypeptidase regulatory-like domain-containing protein, partial [Verrucomicrobia bacterium]|nr:carboxypeptidase regulatory-like domain-containing protein [Verrucomicrobiota bacterium]